MADAAPEGNSMKTLTIQNSTIDETEIRNYDLLEEIILLPEETFNENEAKQMIKRIGKIHPFILQRLVQTRVQLKLFTGSLTDQPEFEHLKGITPRGYTEDGPTWDDVPGIGGTRLVLAKIGNSNKGEGHGSVNLELHELAHSVDRIAFDFIRDDSTFLGIWYQEAQNQFPNQPYFLNYPEEYFAESFAMYYLNEDTRNELKEKSPLTFEFLTNLEQIENNNLIVSIVSYH